MPEKQKQLAVRKEYRRFLDFSDVRKMVYFMAFGASCFSSLPCVGRSKLGSSAVSSSALKELNADGTLVCGAYIDMKVGFMGQGDASNREMVYPLTKSGADIAIHSLMETPSSVRRGQCPDHVSYTYEGSGSVRVSIKGSGHQWPCSAKVDRFTILEDDSNFVQMVVVNETNCLLDKQLLFEHIDGTSGYIHFLMAPEKESQACFGLPGKQSFNRTKENVFCFSSRPTSVEVPEREVDGENYHVLCLSKRRSNNEEKGPLLP